MPLKISTVFGIHFKQRQINGSVICEIRDSLQDNTVINSALNNSLYRSLSLANGCVVLISVGCRQRCRLTSLTFVFLVPTIRSIRCKCHLFCRSRHAPVTSTLRSDIRKIKGLTLFHGNRPILSVAGLRKNML